MTDLPMFADFAGCMLSAVSYNTVAGGTAATAKQELARSEG
jgi:hypothetical protein